MPVEAPTSLLRHVFVDLGGSNVNDMVASSCFSEFGEDKFLSYCATVIQKHFRQYRQAASPLPAP